MVSNICNRLTNYLSNLSTPDRVIALGTASLGLYFGGIPAMIIAAGSYLALRNWDDASKPKAVIQDPPPPQSQPASIDFVVLKKTYVVDQAPIDRTDRPVSLTESVNLGAPVGKPCRIAWEGNSCFVSSIVWTGFLNEPTVLQEIPKAIQRRLSAIRNSIDSILADRNLSEQGMQSLIEIGTLVGQNRPITKGDLNGLCHTLKQHDDSSNPDRVKELLSLLELYRLIDHCQTNASVDGARINELRISAHRVNSSFKEYNGETGDAYELFRILADLVFAGSRLNQNLVTTQFVRPQIDIHRLDPEVGNPETGKLSNQPTQDNWGRFEMPLLKGASVKALLERELDDPTVSAMNLKAQGCADPKPFNVFRKTNQFAFAPPLLVLNIKRTHNDPVGIPVKAEPFFELEGSHFRDGQGAAYELYGVCKHLGTFQHYVADLKRDRKTHFHCDDLSGKVDSSNLATLIDSANTGYILFYRKVNPNLKPPEDKTCIVM